MTCSAPSYTGMRTDNIAWANWSGRVERQLASVFVPATGSSAALGALDAPLPPAEGLLQLARLVQDATLNFKSLHPIGSGWAFDDQAVGDDWTVDIRQMRSRLLGTVGEALVPSSPPTLQAVGPGLTNSWRARQADRQGTRKLVHVEAGIKLWQLVQALDAVGLALPTLGGATGQALAGVINTSVHGGDWNQPPFPDLVRALHLITHGGEELWIEPVSAPVTQDDRLRPTLACPSVRIVRSDEVFQAALVGLGRFGVVAAFVLEVQPQFWVAEVATALDLASTFSALRTGAAAAANPFDALLRLLAANPGPVAVPESRSGQPPRFFQLVLTTRNPPVVWAQRRWETSNQTDLNLPAPTAVPGDMVAAAMTAVFLANPLNGVAPGTAWNPTVDAIVNNVFGGEMTRSALDGRRGRHAWITAGPPNGLPPTPRGVSAEVMFDASDPAYVDFLQTVMQAGGRFQQAGWLSVRPSVASRATLSMHNVGGSHAVSIEIALLGGMAGNEPYLSFVQDQALASGGRLHWGQANNRLNAQQVASQYGALLERWRRALHRVSADSRVFSNQFTRTRGLEPLAGTGGLCAAVPSTDRLLVARSGALQTREWAPTTGWQAWRAQEMAVVQDGGPVSAVAEGGRTHLVFVGSDGGVYSRTRSSNGLWSSIWSFVTTTNLERPWLGVPGGAVHAVSTDPGQLQVLYANASGRVIAVQGENDGAGNQWRTRRHLLAGRTTPGGSITGVSRRPGQLDVFMVGLDRRVLTAAWNATDGWRGWWPLPGLSAPPGARVTAVSRGTDQLDVFVTDEHGRILSAAWSPTQGWAGGWHIQAGTSTPGAWVAAVCREPDQLDVFMIGTNGRLQSAAWNPAEGWKGWWTLGPALALLPGAKVAAVSRSRALLDVFVADTAGQTQTLAWSPQGGWKGPWPL